MNINIKELCKQIKKSKFFIWSLVDGVHYLTNRHWAIKFTELPRDVLIQLFSIYAEVPTEGKTLSRYRGGDITESPVNVAKVFDDASINQVSGSVTPFLKVHDELNMRVINLNGKFTYVNNEYLKIIADINRSNPAGRGMFTPICFNDNTFIVLPYRTTDEEHQVILKELVAS